MNMAIYVVPSLQPESDASVACNCLLNCSAWSGEEEFCYTYTLLLPEDIPRYLGCRVIRMNAIIDILILGPLSLPRRLSELASREELTSWLTRVLLNIIQPGRSQAAPCKIRLPNNLVAFFGLLLHLHRVGFPGHWLADFLRSILSGNFVTDLDSYRGTYPIPPSELTRKVPRRYIRLDPWFAEFETVIAIANKGIPFSVFLPKGFAHNASDIGTFEALVRPARIFTNATYHDPSPFEPVTRLMFFKKGNRSAESVIRSVMEGKDVPPPGELHIVTAPEAVQYQKRIVWKMSRKRVEKMRQEKWEMVAYRSDTYEMGGYYI